MPSDCDSGPRFNWDWVSQRQGTVTFLVVLAILALIAWNVQKRQGQRARLEALARIEELGGAMGWDGRYTFYGVNFHRRPVGDEALELLEPFDLQNVFAEGTRVTGAGLKSLREMKSLNELDLADTQVGDEGLVHLRGLRLRWLRLAGTEVTDDGLDYLKELPGLEWLSLSGTKVTDAGLLKLAAFPRLRTLHIKGERVTTQGIAALREAMPHLSVNPVDDPEMPQCP